MPVAVSITANASGFKAGANQVATSSRGMATAIRSSASQASGALGSMTDATRKLATAERQAADAAGQVRVAEAKLADVRAKGKAMAAQRVQAEENLYRATRKLAIANSDVASSQLKLNAAAERATAPSLTQRITENADDLDRVSGSLLRIGTVGAVGLAASAKAAIDWQSDWAGVTKTVDGSASEMAVLEGQLRGLAKTLPASHHEIAAVAEAAGQLGIQRTSVAAFTKTMIDLGETTNLSADEAATSLAQFSNVMGTSSTDVGRLGSTIVGLGNAGASTERDIVSMGLRIAGAGKQVGLSETQVLAYASALSSVGIEAEAGGTAVSTSFLKIDQMVRKGGAGLELLASTAGMSGAEFKRAFQEDAATAVASFVSGLGRVQQQGGDTTAILRELGITGIRESDALRRLASSGDLLTDSLGTANTAWRENTALLAEAEKRYATAESQARIAWNSIKDSAISAGTSMLPIIAEIATSIASVAQWFGDLPDPVRFAGVAIVATTAIMALAGGGAIKAVTGLLQLRAAYQATGAAATGAGRAMKAAQAATVVGIALTAITTAVQFFASQSSRSKEAALELGAAMQTIEGDVTAATAAMNENVRASTVMGLQQSGAIANAKTLGIDLMTLTDAALGNADAMTRVKDAVLAGYKGTSDQAQASARLGGQLRTQAEATQLATQAEQDRRAAMGESADASTSAASAYDTAATSLRAISTESNSATQSLDDLIRSLFETGNAALAVSNAQVGFEQAIDAAAEAAKKNGENLKVSTKAGQENRTALNNLASQGMRYVESLVAQGRSADKVESATRKARETFIDSAVAMGKSRSEAKRLADDYGLIPKDVRTKVDVDAEQAEIEARRVDEAIKGLPKDVQTKVRAAYEKGGLEAALAKVEQYKSSKPNVKATSTADTKGFDKLTAEGKKLKDRKVKAISEGDTSGAKKVDQAQKALRDKAVKAVSKGDISGSKKVEAAQRALKDKLVDAITRGDTRGARQVAAELAGLRSKTVYITTVVSKKILSSGTARSTGAEGRRDGGKIATGSTTPRADDVPVMASRGEWYIQEPSSRKYGDAAMAAVNAGTAKIVIGQGAGVEYRATGGRVGTGTVPVQRFAGGGQVSDAGVVRLIGKTSAPLADIASLVRQLSALAPALAAANRVLARPRAALERAKARKTDAVEDRQDLRDRVARLKRQADATKGTTAADREYKRAQQQLTVANNRVTRATQEQTKAQQAYSKAAESQKAVLERVKAAEEALASRRQQVADDARQISSGLAQRYDTKSLSPEDLISRKSEGAAALTQLNDRLLKLRNAGLAEAVIQDVATRGPLNGVELADAILKGGKTLIAAMNAAQTSLVRAADAVGYTQAVGVKRKDGGWVTGPEGDDKVHLFAKPREFVVNEEAARINGSLLERINADPRAIVDQRYVQAPAAYGGVDRSVHFHGDLRGPTAREVAVEVMAMMRHQDTLNVPAWAG